jgi:PAS domain S-box-containing protein
MQSADLSEGSCERVVSMCPERLRSSIEGPELRLLAKEGRSLDSASVWNEGRGPQAAREALRLRDWKNALILPLSSGETRQGFLIVLGLASDEQHERIAATLDQMARVIALALRNSLLFEKLERTVDARTQEILRQERVFHTLTEALPVGILRFDTQGSILYANERWWEIGGMLRSDYMGRHWSESVAEEDRAKALELCSSELDPARGGAVELRFGPLRSWVLAQVVEERGADRAVSGYIASVTDIGARKAAEEQLRASFEEKEALLRELYHRTRNTMQIISAMLSLQGFRCRDEEARRGFKEIENKIQGMALVQAGLYESRNFSGIDLEAYLSDLASLLYTNYEIEPSRIAIELDTLSVTVPIDTAIPFGLLVNELVSNSLKFAFPEGRRGTISISLHIDGEDSIVFGFEDDGVGLPPFFDCRRDGGVGLQNIVALSETQLGGELRFPQRPGFSLELRFPRPLAEPGTVAAAEPGAVAAGGRLEKMA